MRSSPGEKAEWWVLYVLCTALALFLGHLAFFLVARAIIKAEVEELRQSYQERRR